MAGVAGEQPRGDPHIQGQERQLHFAELAARRVAMRAMGGLRPRSEKPQ